MSWSFIQHITDSMTRPRRGDPKHPTLWPSALTAVCGDDERVVGACRRNTFLRYIYDLYQYFEGEDLERWRPLVEEIESKQIPVDAYMRWIWVQGELYEKYCIEEAKNSGIYISDQMTVYLRDLNLSGRIDIEVINPVTVLRSLIETKSVYGFGGNAVLGTPAQRRMGVMGTPRESNMMQLGMYQWRVATDDPAYEEGRLVYGARDTGRYAEYLVEVFKEEDGLDHLGYKPFYPYESDWVITPITIQAIFRETSKILRGVEGTEVPARDYDLCWSDQRLARAHAEGELNRTETAQYDKWLARQAYNNWLETIPQLGRRQLIDGAARHLEQPRLKKYRKEIEGLEGKEPTDALVSGLQDLKPDKDLKPVEKGDWQCDRCRFKDVCYGTDASPREL